MKYVIERLKKIAIEHATKISEIESIDPEMSCDLLFAEEEVQNHKDCIQQVNEAIKYLNILNQ